jgi:hypothetical protein
MQSSRMRDRTQRDTDTRDDVTGDRNEVGGFEIRQTVIGITPKA